MLKTATAPAEEEDLLPRLRRLRGDKAYYARACLRIQIKDPPALRWLEFNRPQQIVHLKLERQRTLTGRVRAVILKARQEGISTGVAARFFHDIHMNRYIRAVVIADEKDRSGKLYEIYDRFNDHLPAEIRPDEKTSLKHQELAYHHGSSLVVETAGDKNATRSLTVHRLHVSEMALFENADDVWISIYSAVPTTGSEIIVESTAQGIGNKFNRLWKQAEAGDTDWLAIFLPWWIHAEYQSAISAEERQAILGTTDRFERQALTEGIPWEPPDPEVGIPAVFESGARYIEKTGRWRLTPEQLAWRRHTIRDGFEGDERGFRQENPATAEEAFLVSGAAFFDPDVLVDLGNRVRPPDRRGMYVRVGGGLIFQDDERGWVRIWEEPEAGAHYVIGGDTAEGKLVAARDTSASDPEGERGGRDFNSADIIKVSELKPAGKGKAVRVPCQKQVAQIHGRMAPEVFAQQIWAAGNWYGCPGPKVRSPRRPALVGIERNHSSGQTTIRELREKYRYPRQYVRRRMNQRTGKPTMDIGWWTDGQTRRPMLDAFAAGVRTGEVQVNSPETLHEMRTFVMADDGQPEAQEGAHDDRVMSFGISLEMARHHSDEPTGDLPQAPIEDTPTGR